MKLVRVDGCVFVTVESECVQGCLGMATEEQREEEMGRVSNSL